MSANFEWQNEEDERRAQQVNWDDAPEPERPGESRRRPPWRIIGLIAGLAILAGAIVWWRVDQRIDSTLQAFRTDVIASHNLIQRAVADGDEEVFRSALSGRLPAWTVGQMEIFTANLFFDRAPLGLVPLEGSLPVILPLPEEEAVAGERQADIEFSADLNEAILTVDQPYRRDATGETVVLRQTTVYRRGDFRWLLAPPMEEFWGDWITTEGDYLSLIYPQRDEAISARLAADIDRQIGLMCATLEDIDCSADLHLSVRLDTDPSVLASMGQPLGALQRAREREDILELPAPTLVGLPVEEDTQQWENGYEALSEGYARHIVGAAIAQAVGWRCCDDAVLFNTLLEFQLSQLGIMTWSIGPVDYRRVLDSHLRLSEVGRHLRNRFQNSLDEDQQWEMRAAVDFLVKGIPGTSAASIQRTLDGTRNFNQFLARVTNVANENGATSIPGNLDLAWWLYAYSAPMAPIDPPLSPPDADLYLACTAVDGNQSTDPSVLLRYLPDLAHWTEMYKRQGFIWMSSLPDPNILLMQEFAMENESWQTNLWRDGEISPAYIPPPDGRYAISFGETDPAGRHMVVYEYDPQAEAINGFNLDLKDCDEGCAKTELPGRPSWSPDGQWAIYTGDNGSFPEDVLVAANDRFILLQSSGARPDLALSLGPGDAVPGSPDLRPIGTGRSPFWLDAQTFGYIRRIAADGPAVLTDEEIVLATLADTTPETVISAADLFGFLPEEIPLTRLSLGYVATHPEQPGRLFIVVLDELDQRTYIVLYDLETGLAESRLETLYYNLNHSLSFSPDGRYLVLTGQDRNTVTANDDNAVILVHDIAENQTVPLMTRLPFFLPSVVYDWTEDSRWLAVAMEDNLVGLVAPDEAYVQLLPHNYGACTSVAWVEK